MGRHGEAIVLIVGKVKYDGIDAGVAMISSPSEIEQSRPSRTLLQNCIVYWGSFSRRRRSHYPAYSPFSVRAPCFPPRLFSQWVLHPSLPYYLSVIVRNNKELVASYLAFCLGIFGPRRNLLRWIKTRLRGNYLEMYRQSVVL